MTLRHLVVVLGDQLYGQSAAFDGFETAQDAILQMEVREEATYIPQHKRRLAFFFAAMRHFREEQRAAGRRVHYSELDDPANCGNLANEVRRWAEVLQPHRIIVLQPGDWRLHEQLSALDLPVEFRPDRHFLCPDEVFAAFADEHPRVKFRSRLLTALNLLPSITTLPWPAGPSHGRDRQSAQTLRMALPLSCGSPRWSCDRASSITPLAGLGVEDM